jgi:hypothetical protein
MYLQSILGVGAQSTVGRKSRRAEIFALPTLFRFSRRFHHQTFQLHQRRESC